MSELVDGANFGNFFYSCVLKRVEDSPIRTTIREVLLQAGLPDSTAYRFFKSATPEPLRIEAANRGAIARAAGFPSWDEFDAAWRKTPARSTPRREGGRPDTRRPLGPRELELRINELTPDELDTLITAIAPEAVHDFLANAKPLVVKAVLGRIDAERLKALRKMIDVVVREGK